MYLETRRPMPSLSLLAGMPEEMPVVLQAVICSYAAIVVGPDLAGTINLCYQKDWPREQNP